MAEPPYPPQGGREPDGSQGRPPEDADRPTEVFDTPGEHPREQTQPFGRPPIGPAGPPPHYGPPYGQQYAPPPYGLPGYGAPWGPPGVPGGRPPGAGRDTLIALVVAGVVVLAAIGVALFLVLRGTGGTPVAGPAPGATRSSPPSTSGPTSPSPSPDGSAGIPPAGTPPDGLGADPVLDGYAQRCYDGDMDACDTLYDDADPGSRYATYGGTCAGRQPMDNSDFVYCTDAFPG